MSEEPRTDQSAGSDRLQEIHALIWRSSATDDEFDQSEFDARIPRLMEWLKNLRAEGKLLGCGGGGFENHSGGLTLVRTESIDETLRIAAENPMNEIGNTEVFVWDVYYADLSVPRDFR